MFFEFTKMISETIAYTVKILFELDLIVQFIEQFSRMGITLWESLYSAVGLTLFTLTMVGIFFTATLGQVQRALRQAGMCFLLIGIVFMWQTAGERYLKYVNALTTEVQVNMMSMVSTATEAKSSVDTVLGYYFNLTIRDPFWLMNYGTVDEETINATNSNRALSLLRKLVTSETWEEIDSYIAEHEKDNRWLTPHKVFSKLFFGMISVVLALLLGIPLVVIGTLNFFIQLFALIFFAFLPIAFILSFIPHFSGAMLSALKNLVALFGFKILVGLLFLLFCYLIKIVQQLIPAKDIYSYFLQMLMISIVMIVIFKKRQQVIAGITGGMVSKATPDVISQGMQVAKGGIQRVKGGVQKVADVTSGTMGVASKVKQAVQKRREQAGEKRSVMYTEDGETYQVNYRTKNVKDKETGEYQKEWVINKMIRMPQVEEQAEKQLQTEVHARNIEAERPTAWEKEEQRKVDEALQHVKMNKPSMPWKAKQPTFNNQLETGTEPNRPFAQISLPQDMPDPNPQEIEEEQPYLRTRQQVESVPEQKHPTLQTQRNQENQQEQHKMKQTLKHVEIKQPTVQMKDQIKPWNDIQSAPIHQSETGTEPNRPVAQISLLQDMPDPSPHEIEEEQPNLRTMQQVESVPEKKQPTLQMQRNQENQQEQPKTNQALQHVEVKRPTGRIKAPNQPLNENKLVAIHQSETGKEHQIPVTSEQHKKVKLKQNIQQGSEIISPTPMKEQTEAVNARRKLFVEMQQAPAPPSPIKRLSQLKSNRNETDQA